MSSIQILSHSTHTHCLSGESSSYEKRFERMSEKDAAEAKKVRSTQTYTKGDTGQTVNAVKNTKATADKRVRDFDAYMEMTGEAKPTKRDMEEWLQGHKSDYKTAMGLASSAKPTTDVVMEWLRAERMAEGTV